MLQAVRYRSGVDAATGRVITGQAHLAQSIATIWRTKLDERFMRLDFGSRLRSHLAEDVTPTVAFEIYDDLVSAIVAWEPEYRMRDFALQSLTRQGGLGIRHAGDYYPEGRFGNRTLVEPFGTVTTLAQAESLALRSLGRAAA